MALLYHAVGFFIGGALALVIMAMFFVSKRAGENEEEMIADLPSAMKRGS